MQEKVLYLGRPVAKDGFRVYIYATDGGRKLVNSWDEYTSLIASGLWFSEPQPAVVKQKGRPRKRTDDANSKGICVSTIPADIGVEPHDTAPR